MFGSSPQRKRPKSSDFGSSPQRKRLKSSDYEDEVTGDSSSTWDVFLSFRDLSGYHLVKDAKENEADTIQEIVEDVMPQTSSKGKCKRLCLDQQEACQALQTQKGMDKIEVDLKHCGRMLSYLLCVI
ncbi:hypothetical protein POM88_015453 [Heracleum sosnowskyi]|uniref:Uncharacterized protein n=1 Tax=Heracleum sosnowskyi TaxID=360622 RepID=A0AAD8IKA7_9APIA|nr:hypothetical protein POM88_015453 [Heracleum sosnowskyi]